MQKVTATEEAISILQQLKEEQQNILLIHSEGCCDGTLALCTTPADFYLGSSYEKIGDIIGVPYYMHSANASYWKHLQILLDVVDGIGNSFSLESTKDKSFIIRAKALDK